MFKRKKLVLFTLLLITFIVVLSGCFKSGNGKKTATYQLTVNVTEATEGNPIYGDIIVLSEKGAKVAQKTGNAAQFN
ncbi:hypothetical protein [Capillibacterium thermochitinicola]|uniref:Uncharacterized protein n=1 Tax=Capillibacterium thermochitinicola TaxID=2699427 RepID=A0A8J6I228_9FIRM|nr:hypothetical protein [Capillibacterium thermochitinicola]MBA2133828.1 hypothetical protein [Capillibacterium thermochitinicola]